MAQHPLKIKWRNGVQHGLSASQFGMALGFCGRVVDFVNYVRNVVGTELEFTGNASTAHGIATESKSRALYELLTGSPVADGGFFLTEDGILGCSPDGQIFCDAHVQGDGSHAFNADEGHLDQALTTVSVRIPFKSKRGRLSGLSPHSVQPPQKRICRRLLEIKSPFRSLYDGSKNSCQPFGIPLQYLCQMQGQMAIADVEECDFFVYLDRPTCQVVAWRVRRSREFWDWACPKLRQVSQWIRDGPPSSMDRRFEFEPFDFSRLLVEPLIFPYDITKNAPILDYRRFPFFERHPNPYREMSCSRPDQDAILHGLTSAITRFLFHTDADLEEKSEENNKNYVHDVLWCISTAPAVRLVKTDSCWNSLHGTCNRNNVDEKVWDELVEVVKPSDFDHGKITCRVHFRGGDVNGGETVVVEARYFQRKFFHFLEPVEKPVGISGKVVAAATAIWGGGEGVEFSGGTECVLSAASCGMNFPQSERRDTSVSSDSYFIIANDVHSFS